MRASMPQRRLILAVAKLASESGQCVILGDAITTAGEPVIQRRTVDACRTFGWIARGDGPAGAPVWDVTDSGRAEVGVDPSTGRPWGVDEDGFDHNLPHPTVNGCPADSCTCGAYHCGWFCQEMHDERSGS